MPLTIEIRETHPIPLEVDSVRLETVREQSLDEVKRTLIQHGNRQVELGEHFDVRGSAADDETIAWQGDCSRVKLIGYAWSSGKVIVEGDAGMHAGAEMTGGEVEVRGNAADWAGAEMKAGRIRITGNAGHCVGAAYRGARRGMIGGTILIAGNAGNEIGHTMRRGLIAIGGDTGDAVGVNMIAGSIFLFGKTGIRPGAGMRRGTIAFFGDAPDLLPTFRPAQPQMECPTWLRVFLRDLRSQQFPFAQPALETPLDRWIGDCLELGKGEILCRADDA